MSDLLVIEVEERCGSALRLASPRNPLDRGSHVVFAHPQGYAVMQALIERGVDRMLELGPGTALADMVRATYPMVDDRAVDDFRTCAGIASWIG